jgi:flavin-binding protein dodecin
MVTGMAHYIVVANRTLGGEALTAQLGGIISTDPDASFGVVVPVIRTAMASFEVGGAMGGIAVLDAEAYTYAQSAAQERLDELLSWFRAVRVPASGDVVTGDPVPVVEALVAERPCAGLIVSTLPSTLSRWVRMDLPQRLRRRVGIPVTVIAAGDDEPIPPAGESHTDPHPYDRTHEDDQPNDVTAERTPATGRQPTMPESVYKIIELVGTSTESWEKAATAAVRTAQQSLRDLRVAEVVQLDLVVGDGEAPIYRAKVKVSFKYRPSES